MNGQIARERRETHTVLIQTTGFVFTGTRRSNLAAEGLERNRFKTQV